MLRRLAETLTPGLDHVGALWAGVAIYSANTVLQAVGKLRNGGGGQSPANELCMKHEKLIGVLVERSERQEVWLKDIDGKLDRLLNKK